MQVEKFIEILQTYPEGSEIVVLWYGQEEFDVTDEDWTKTVKTVDLDTADQLMREEIEDTIQHAVTVRKRNSTTHLKSVTL